MKDFIVIEKGKKGKREIGQLYKGKTVRISVQKSWSGNCWREYIRLNMILQSNSTIFSLMLNQAGF